VRGHGDACSVHARGQWLISLKQGYCQLCTAAGVPLYQRLMNQAAPVTRAYRAKSIHRHPWCCHHRIAPGPQVLSLRMFPYRGCRLRSSSQPLLCTIHHSRPRKHDSHHHTSLLRIPAKNGKDFSGGIGEQRTQFREQSMRSSRSKLDGMVVYNCISASRIAHRHNEPLHTCYLPAPVRARAAKACPLRAPKISTSAGCSGRHRPHMVGAQPEQKLSQANPYSGWQSFAHPSPPSRFPSSQPSLPSVRRSPHTGCTMCLFHSRASHGCSSGSMIATIIDFTRAENLRSALRFSSGIRWACGGHKQDGPRQCRIFWRLPKQNLPIEALDLAKNALEP